MRIGILSQWYPPEPGSASVPGVLARSMASRGHEVVVATGFPNYPLGRIAPGYRMRWRTDERDGDVLIRRVALYPSHDRSKLRRSLSYASFAASATVSATSLLRTVDAIWVYNSPATVGLPSATASLVGGPPHLMHVMDLWPDSILFSGLATGRTYRAMARILDQWCAWTYRRAGAIACISRGMVDELARRGVPRTKLHYVPVWTDEEQYRPLPPSEQLRRELGVEDAFVLLYAGNLGDTQGLDGLLEVCQRITDLPVRILLAGSGTAEGRLRADARRRRLPNVNFLGRWPADDMGRLLSVADVALVSLSDDPLTVLTMPSKLPAILAAGRPVLAWASGEVARTVRAGGCGFVADPGDIQQLEAAVRNAYRAGPDGRERLAAASVRHYRAEFSLQTGVEAVEGLLEDMIARRALAGRPSSLAATGSER
ncbi:MAG TPA: glycosyltransferase family 4 protein [Acidimicrobiales bacterium]|nr:glycosyltransferase family 4 protein [Acidimicrobiales bacterium]